MKDFIWTGGYCHLYLNHLEQAKLQLTRATLPLAKLKLNQSRVSILDYVYEDIEIINYQSQAKIPAPIAV